MNLGDLVYVLTGLDVEEWEVYENGEKGTWIRRDGRCGMRYDGYLTKAYPTLDEAVAASKATRERSIRRCAAEMVRLATNTGVKVRLLKKRMKTLSQ